MSKPNIFWNWENWKFSPVLFPMKSHKLSHKGVILSQSQNKWIRVSSNLSQKKQNGESILPIL